MKIISKKSVGVKYVYDISVEDNNNFIASGVVVHNCQSYELGSQIFQALSSAGLGERIICPKNADEREESFKIHAQRKNSILISPSMKEGFDFAEDLARWQIIAKVPYPALSDKRISRRLELDPDWYTMVTIMQIVQACGRICRSENDFGLTYILDSDARTLLDKAKRLNMIPAWWERALFFH